MPASPTLRFQVVSCLKVVVCSLPLFVTGCSNSDSSNQSLTSAESQADDTLPDIPKLPGDASADNADQPTQSQNEASAGNPPQAGGQGPAPGMLSEKQLQPSPALEERKLRPNLPPADLVRFLAAADEDLKIIMSGRAGLKTFEEARDKQLSIVRSKLEASKRLLEHADASAAMRSEGARGQLQALSHLASMGDLKSAEELETIATDNLKSEDAALVGDSQLVLIGFAIEGLQNGKEGAAGKIVQLVDAIAANSAEPDVPALMVMGQARQVLLQYEHVDEAKHVRKVIVDLYGDAKDPTIAMMAAQIAGNVQYDEINVLRGQIVKGETVTADQWKSAVETLIAESADIQTVQYLAGAALELESVEQEEMVNITLQALVDQFDDPDSVTGKEVELAVAARQARQQVIGLTFTPDLKSVDGKELNLDTYRGKVVLVPFWATGFPASLQLVPALKALVEEHGDKVAIVGVNLDRDLLDVQKFAAGNDLGFPSFYAQSSPTADVANPVAAQFGMVSMPFLAILDKEGKVAAINYTGRELSETVATLVGDAASKE